MRLGDFKRQRMFVCMQYVALLSNAILPSRTPMAEEWRLYTNQFKRQRQNFSLFSVAMHAPKTYLPISQNPYNVHCRKEKEWNISSYGKVFILNVLHLYVFVVLSFHPDGHGVGSIWHTRIYSYQIAASIFPVISSCQRSVVACHR